jgi:transposase-like protein
MPRCEGAYRTISELSRFKLDPQAFPGGVALWGAVEPVYNTAHVPAERGIHVHARLKAGKRKVIDHTYDAVELTVPRDLLSEGTVLITGETAVAYYLSRFLNRRIVHIFCPYCQTPHLDSDWFSVKPHRVHLCHGCNRLFKEDVKRVSNPLEAVRHKLGDRDENRKTVRAKGPLEIRQSDYPFGLQIWASNPALLWTSKRGEEEGIHVHGWKRETTDPQLDGTFDRVRIDGIELDEELLRHFMAQNALVYLRRKVVSLHCPACGAAKFDRGDAAFRPKSSHQCDTCRFQFETPGRRRLVVSNPFVETLAALQAARMGTRH